MTNPRTPDPRNDEISPVTELSGAEEDSGWEDAYDPGPYVGSYAGSDLYAGQD